MLTNQSDEALWLAMRSGDESAFTALYSRYFQTLFGYGRRISDQGEIVVKDAIQDLFIDLWRARHTLGQAEAVRFYLLRSLRRRIHRILKNDYQQEGRLEDFSEDAFPAEASVETHFLSDEDIAIQAKRIALWLNRLPPRQNEAVVLHYYHNMTYQEIADILDIKEQTARNLVQKALQLIRREVVNE